MRSRIKIYTYKNCDTCRRALKFLEARGVACDVIPIREQPPALSGLKQMLKAYGGQVRKLFNTSGQDYQRLHLKDKLPLMSEDEALQLLARNGYLVKRPFLLSGAVRLVAADRRG